MTDGKVNLAKRIGADYTTFGVLVLDDDTGEQSLPLRMSTSVMLTGLTFGCFSCGFRETTCDLGHSCGCPTGHWTSEAG